MYRQSWCALGFVCLYAFCIDAIAASGRTPTRFDVSQTGEAGYVIPLWVPPGTRGMTPQLAIAYGHRNTSTLLGVGWGISGLSAISRCERTFAQDGEARDVRNDWSDRYCLDGNRMRVVAGTYGGAGSEYRTELETFARIRSYGVAGNGPASFEVETQDGLIHEYGATADSRIESAGQSTVRTWAVNKIRDRDGNAVLFTYAEDAANGSFRIDLIQYSSAYSVDFVYETKPVSEIDSGYFAGSIIREVMRLDHVKVSYNSTLLRQYELTYEETLSSTSRSRLASIQECAVPVTDCFPPTTFSYQNGSIGLSGEADSGATPSSYIWLLDVNGDGRDDLVYPSNPNDGAGHWMVALAHSAGGFSGAVNTGIVNYGVLGAIRMDYDSDGREDLLVPYSGGTWWAMLGTSSGLASPLNTGALVSGSGARAHAIDVDGDGREDLVWADLTGFAGGDAVRYRLRVPGGAFSGTVGTLVGPLPVNEKLESGIFGPAGQRDPYDVPDFNGDGRNDIVYRHSRREFDFESQTYTHYYSIRALVPGGWTFETSTGGVNSTPQIADFNGDGKTDLLYYNGANWRYQFSRGTSFGASNVGPSILPYLADWVILDWDGDGYDDVLVPHTSSGTWHLMRSTGEALLNPVPTGMPWTSGALAVGDTNGDGLDDFTYTVGTSFRFRTRAGAYPDLLLTATDGFDNAATFSYAPITNASYYAKHADAAFPEQDYQGGLYVVSSLLAPDGIGGTYTSSFFYYGARIHLQGRGFEGFWSRRAHDSRTGLFAYDYHRRDFPFIGLTFQADILQPNNATLIRRTQRTPGYHSYSSGYEVRYFPHVTQETTSEYEVGGTYNSAQKRTVSTSYAFDSQSGALYDRTTTLSEPSTANGVQAGASYVQRIYHPSLFTDIANWCLGRPASTQLINSHSLHGGTAQTRTVGRSWNGAKCRPTQIQIEPGDTLWQVTVDVGYDAFGNPNSETLTGIDMPARTTTLNWGTTGQFPVSMTNALSQTTQFGWDLARGAKTSETDPNGIAISWQYDPYGRVTREDRPDGTWTQRTYNDCAASGCQGSQNRMIVIAAQGSGSTTIRDTWTYLDAFERPIVTSAKMLTGAYNRVDRQYDAMGRLFRESAPCWWASCSTQFWTTYSYDLLDRPTQVSRPTSDSDPTPAITTLYHEGLTTRTVDPQARQRTQIVNVLGRTARSVDHTGYYQSFDFDAFGSLVRVQDSLLATLLSATYNVRGMQMTATDIDRGAWSYGYNALGERTSHTDANLATTIYTYDALSRPLMRQMPEGTGSITSLFTWGQFADNTPTAKHVGRLKQMQISGTGVSAYSETYAYDSIGRPSQTTYNDGTNHVFDFAYDTTTGLLRDVTYPVSTEAFRLQARYEYQNGFLKRVRNFNNNLTFWEAQETDARGLLTRETLGDDPNGYVFDTVSSFDQVTGLLESRQATYTSDELVGTAIENHSYFWDNVGNLLQRQDNRQGLTENFYYDALYRLDYSTLNATQNLDLAYDARGNITSKSGVGTYAYHPTKLHAVASVNTGSGTLSYSYDANGQMTNRNGTTISWYASNLPKSVTKDASNSSSFQYTPDGRRWRHTYVTAGSTYTTSYFGSYMEKVLEPGGVTSWKHFILAGGEAVTVYIRKGGAKDRYLLVKDHLGSPTAMVHARDGLYLRESASAYGSRRGTNWTGTPSAGDLTKMNTVTRRGFTFHEHLDSTDPVHMNGRVYDPLLGRFASGDPFTAPATDTQSWNRYSYVINRPLSFSDPSGFLRRPWILPPDALAEIWSTAIERLATRDSGGGGGGGNQSSDGGGVGSPPGAEYGDEAEEPTTVIPLQPQGQQSQGLPEIVVVAYQGQFHDELVAQLAEAMRATGADVVTELPLCFEGGGCARIDIFGRDPTGNELFALEVKTGLNPRFTPGQLAVYPHLRRGGLVVSPDPRIVRFGWPTGVPLPSINGILLYQKDERSPPVIVPIP